MEDTPHFGCWCKLCMLREWMELETEINNLVFGRQESYYAMAPSSALIRCTFPNSPVTSTTASPFGTSLSPNEEAFHPKEYGSATTQRTAEQNLSSLNYNNITQDEKSSRPTCSTFQRSKGTSPKRMHQFGCQSLSEYDSTNPRSLQTVNICIPPRSTAKRQKKTPADLERAEPPRCKRLHVSNIPFWFEDHHLIKIFQEFGNVTQAEVIYNDRGSKGFGFVTFEDENQATDIRKLFNGMELHGRVIEVNYASKRQGNKNRAQTQREDAKPERTINENPRNDKGPPCRHCDPSYVTGRRPNGAGAWPPQRRQNDPRIPRMPPVFGWPQNQRRKFGPRF